MRKTALITGGAKGIGLGISEALANINCDIAICGRKDKSDVKKALEKIKAHGTNVLYCQCDISDSKSRSVMIKKIIERFGKLNILVNNAGIAPPERKDVLKASEASFDRVISVNLKGPYFLTQLVANKMVEAKQKDPDFEAGIINITSVSAELPSRNRGDYCISKAGLSMTTKLWASRLGEFDIPVYEIRPGIIETDMTAGVKDKYDELIQNGLLVNKRWGTPEDIGKATAAIVEGSFSYSTGLIINADGGLTLQSL